MIFLRALRFIFHLLYHQFAWTYDWVAGAVSGGQWVNWVRSVLPELQDNGNVLEIGHGPGYLVEALIQAGRPVVGVDLSPQMGRRAMRHLRSIVRQPALAQADARCLPFPDGAFDCIVATFPAEYIAEPVTWESFKRVMSPHGRMVILIGARPGGLHPLNILSRILFRITGQLSREDALKARLQLNERLAAIGLQWALHTRKTGNTETYLLIAEHAQDPLPVDAPAV